ncbi:FAD:protein FMN transferase [Iodobacter sp.]|uniref:FAD:protein FMN transferase n=1 Tax=Iodobacter sp. TaxID=1915058 RepID=UPI0025D003A8|nr:FAD:protein FMN transferase [Iodobacter sp.]
MIKIFLLVGVLLLSACSKAPLYQQESYVFGTRVQISIWGLPEDVAQKHAAAVFADLDRIHTRLHPWQPSEITRINASFARGEPALIDTETAALLKQASQYAERSDQLFNPAMGGLITAWGFHKDSYAPVLPSQASIDQLLAGQPSMQNLSFEASTVSSSNPAVQLDTGGFAKGWALDRAAAYLRKHRVNNALINIGGNVLALGKKDQTPWVVGIQHPREPQAMATIALKSGEAIGTSGDYQRFFEVGGKRYSHLIDPRTGQPATTMEAATVIAPPSLEAGAISDIATKPIFIGGIGKTLHYAQRFGLQDVLIVGNDGSVYITEELQRRISWIKPPVHIYRLR